MPFLEKRCLECRAEKDDSRREKQRFKYLLTGLYNVPGRGIGMNCMRESYSIQCVHGYVVSWSL